MPYKDPAAQREFQRQWCAARRADATAGRVCEGCGSTERLEWHHLTPGEKISHRIWSWAPERIAKELEKCVPLCVDCHREVTARQRRIEAIERNPHGTRARNELGCKCVACKRAKADYNAARKREREAAALPAGKAA